jgi:hypothetical protein
MSANKKSSIAEQNTLVKSPKKNQSSLLRSSKGQ